MSIEGFPILSALILLPLAGVLPLLAVRDDDSARAVTFAVTFLTFLLSLPLYFGFDPHGGMQFVERLPWIERYGISYYLGVDGLSLLLVMLTTFLSPLCVLACWRDITFRVRDFMICWLLLETGLLGVFLSLDLFLFYVFWEFSLIPMYLIIGVWGSPARRVYSAVKFFIYTMVGSLLMLVAIMYLYFAHARATGEYTFDLFRLYGTPLSFRAQCLMFLAFALAFAIKVPMFPFHTWLPDAHTEAPTVGSVMLAAVLLKMGCYGFLRFAMPLFPQAFHQFAPLLIVLAIVGIIYGALVSLVQVDLKRLVAFSSVSHLGFCMLGVFALNLTSATGGLLQMVNHGLSTGALFLCVGILYERRHTRLISEFGGIARVMPLYAVLFGIVTFSSLGLPGLNGFVGEFLVLLGTFKANWVYAAFAATGVILAAWYLLWAFQRVMYGEVTKEENRGLPDLSKREFAVLASVVLFIIWIGVYPKPFLQKIEPSVRHFIAQVQQAAPSQAAALKVNPERRM